jgi:hypothetical protein
MDIFSIIFYCHFSVLKTTDEKEIIFLKNPEIVTKVIKEKKI